jgi:hypothetical protein
MHPVFLGRASTLKRMAFCIDVAAMLWERRRIQIAAQDAEGHLLCEYGWADSSPQGHKDWMLAQIDTFMAPAGAPLATPAGQGGFDERLLAAHSLVRLRRCGAPSHVKSRRMQKRTWKFVPMMTAAAPGPAQPCQCWLTPKAGSPKRRQLGMCTSSEIVFKGVAFPQWRWAVAKQTQPTKLQHSCTP